jgi:hypothetical protein
VTSFLIVFLFQSRSPAVGKISSSSQELRAICQQTVYHNLETHLIYYGRCWYAVTCAVCTDQRYCFIICLEGGGGNIIHALL